METSITKPIAVCLDDLQIRHIAFDKLYGEKYQIFHVYNFIEFFKLITKLPYDVDFMSLDHDLGDPAITGTGRDAVQLLIALNPDTYKRPQVNVHSHNVICGEEMFNDLQSAGFKATYEVLEDIDGTI